MKTMDYITSRDICYLICDVLSLIDKKPVEHGMRVAYLLTRFLDYKGGYEEFEIAEFGFLAMLHDIGVYKTEKSIKDTDYETEETGRAHAIYGSIFLKNTTGFGNRADVVLYHHLPYDKIKTLCYEHERVVMYLSMLEDVDKQYVEKKGELDYQFFEKNAGKRYMPEAVMLLMKYARKEQILKKFESGEYKQELYDYMYHILFTNEEKEQYVKLAMRVINLRSRSRAAEMVMSRCIAEEIADEMEMAPREREKLRYAVMLRDIGLLNIDKKFWGCYEELSPEGKLEAISHVEVGVEILKKYFISEEIPDIVAAHHERLDGSGYPKGIKENRMNKFQFIVQVADLVTELMNKRETRPAMKREEIMERLLEMVEKKMINKRIVERLIQKFDIVERKLQMELKNYLETQVRMNNQYKNLMGSNFGEKE